MTACRGCKALLADSSLRVVHVVVEDGATLKGRLRTRRLGPFRKRVPGAILCAACFQEAEVEFERCRAEHTALVAGGMSPEMAAAAMLDRGAS